MSLIPTPFRALILGSTGAIGAALRELLSHHPDCSEVVGLNRGSDPSIDYDQLDSLERAYQQLATLQPFHLIINTIGELHTTQWGPEKKLADINETQLARQFLINSIGPALTLKHFTKLIAPEGGVMATLSAKVGSISDNRLGGWYSYRASKAALNMLIKTAAIELKRTRPNVALVAVHPGTVKSKLSRPFRGEQIGRDPVAAGQDILSLLMAVTADETGCFKAYSGEILPW